jgi:hypothetical protein
MVVRLSFSRWSAHLRDGRGRVVNGLFNTEAMVATGLIDLGQGRRLI